LLGVEQVRRMSESKGVWLTLSKGRARSGIWDEAGYIMCFGVVSLVWLPPSRTVLGNFRHRVEVEAKCLTLAQLNAPKATCTKRRRDRKARTNSRGGRRVERGAGRVYAGSGEVRDTRRCELLSAAAAIYLEGRYITYTLSPLLG